MENIHSKTKASIGIIITILSNKKPQLLETTFLKRNILKLYLTIFLKNYLTEYFVSQQEALQMAENNLAIL